MKFLPALFCLLVALPARSQHEVGVTTNTTATTQLQIKAGFGVASYEENVSIEPVDSEWSAPLAEISVRLNLELPDVFLSFSGQTWAADKDRETWTQQGQLVQVNQMQAVGAEATAGIGPRFPKAGAARIQPLVLAGVRAQSFERSQFVTNGRSVDLGTVDEDYALAFGGVALELSVDSAEGLFIGTRLEADYMFFNEAENSLLSEPIEGDGGLLLKAEAEVGWHVRKNATLSLGVQVDHQELEGASFQGVSEGRDGPSFSFVEWPDNTLSRLTGTVALRIQL